MKAIKPQLEHQQKAEKWLGHWQGIVEYCYDERSLAPVMTAMDIQIQEFADLPEIIKKAQQIISNQLLAISREY